MDGDDRISVFDPGREVEGNQSRPQSVGDRGTYERKYIDNYPPYALDVTFPKYSGKAKVRRISCHSFLMHLVNGVPLACHHLPHLARQISEPRRIRHYT